MCGEFLDPQAGGQPLRLPSRLAHPLGTYLNGLAPSTCRPYALQP
jgi:hypothetical protein